MNINKMLQMIPLRLLYLILGMFFIITINFAQNNNCTLQNGNLVVTNTNDSGPGSLRNAIECANTLVGPNRIIFNIGGGGNHTIFVGTTTSQPLPSLVDAATVIDATTQAGDVARPRITLDGSGTTWTVPINGLFVLANQCEIYGLEIRNFPDDGIDVFNAQNVIIGKPNKGNVIHSNGEVNDFYTAASPNGPWEGSGIVLRNESKFCQIQSNVIGTDASLSSAIGNEYCGILIQGASSNNIIGGNSTDSRNIIAYNLVGVRIESSSVCSVYSNNIFCNAESGIQLSNLGNNNKIAPVIERASTQLITGKANPQDVIEIFVNYANNCSDKPCQGRVFVGRTVTQRDSTWRYDVSNLDFGTFDLVTATATDIQGNTSAFAACRSLISTASSCADVQGIITVTNTNDDGIGSLRAAIDCANNSPGANKIVFNIPGNDRKIIYVGATTSQPLPPLVDGSTIIDGATQPGFGSNNSFEPQIILDGAQYAWNYPHDALLILGNSCEVYALEFRNFPDDGIDITGANFVKIGAPQKGNVIYNCGIAQDFFDGAVPRGAWEGCGIVLQGNTTNCKISSNIIGTNYSRTLAIGNEFCGISLNDNENNHIIGGTTTEEGNIIAYNPSGVLLESGANKIQISKNSFICNDTVAIALVGAANAQKHPPTITAFTTQRISGKATAGDLVEVFISSTSICPNQPCQGQIYLGATRTNADGNWTLEGPFSNSVSLSQTMVITATATDNQGNTSPFASCFTTNVTNCDNFKANIINVRGETCDRDNGSFTVNVTGGTAPYLYNIGAGVTLSPDFSNLNAATYAVTITDAANCQATQAIRIERLDPPAVIIIDQEDAICGQPTGTFTIVPLRGLFPFTYDIGNSSTSEPIFENLAPGQYIVTITDASGCATTQPVAIGAIETMKLTILDIVDATCGLNNGKVVAGITGGIAPIVYKVGSRVFTEPVFDNLAAGAYQAIATDANGCTAIHDFTIQASPPLTLNVVSVKAADCTQSGGAITVATVGGIPPILFNYGNGITTNPTFSNLFAGTYLITATDSKGCTAITTARVEAGSPFEVSIQNVNNASCGNANAAFTVKAENGQAPYLYAINGGSATTQFQFTGLSAGQYSVLVTDARGCSVKKEVTISNIPPLSINIVNVIDADCANGAGSFSVFPSGGVLPVNYDIGLGQTSNPFFTDLQPGNYTIKATDALGCVTTSQVTIGLTGSLTAETLNITDATCGEANGSFEIKVTSGNAPYQYRLESGNSNSNRFTNLQAGTYKVTITDRIGCQTVQSAQIKAGVNLATRISRLNPATCAQPNGGFSVEVLSGTPPYNYSMGQTTLNSPDFKNLAAGNYVVTITDAKGCRNVQNLTIPQTPPIRIALAEKQDASCGLENGKIEVKIESGTPPYRYNIGNGFVNSGVFDSLAADRYTITVTDSVGCSTTENVEITKLSDAITATITDIAIATCGQSNGSFTVNATSGVAPFTYNIGSGNTTNSTFQNLSEGVYLLRMTDAKGCALQQDVFIEETSPVTVDIINLKEATCGNANGSFTIAVTSGLPPFTYNIGNGNGNDSIFNALAGGLYKVTINDANGCFTSQNVIIEADPPLTLQNVEREPSSCGNANGKFKVTIIGGSRPYIFSIPGKSNNTGVFEGLEGGTYALTVTDNKGCSLEQSVEIEAPNPLTAEVLDVRSPDCDDSGGAFTVVASNGLSPYLYDIGTGPTANNTFSDVRPGDYKITVTDANGCKVTTKVSLVAASNLNLQLLSQRRPSCGQPNGSITVSANGGIAPYSFTLGNNTSTSPIFENLSPGNYLVKVTDGSGCTATVRIDLPAENTPPTVRIQNKQDASCRQTNGSFTLAVSGGSSPYTYNLGRGATNDSIFNNLAVGSYAVTITDANGCAVIQIVNITSTPELRITIDDVENARCGLSNGAFQVIASGGNPPYLYDIGNGTTSSASFTNLSVGNYTITVTDARACKETHDITIENAAPMSVTLSNRRDASCGSANGTFTAVVIGGKTPYSYNLGTGTTTNARFENLAAGTYQLTVTDDEGCIKVTSVTIAGTTAPTLAVTNVTEATCGNSNGAFTLSASGGKSPYTFNIGNGASNRNTFTDLAPGQYAVTTTDANGCTATINVNLTSNSIIPLARFILDSTDVVIELTNMTLNADSIIWDLGDGIIYAGQNIVTHRYDSSGIYNICLTASNSCGTDTYCQQLVYEVAASNIAEISGQVYTETEGALRAVNINCSGVNSLVTGLDGTYQFKDLSIGRSYEVRPEKNDDLTNGISTYDIFLLNSHVLTTDTLDSPYKIIAGDINKSGTITTFDVLLLRRILLGLDTILPSGNTSWRFVEANFEFSDSLQPFLDTFHEKALINLTRTTKDVNFIAVKIGDLNNSAILNAAPLENRNPMATTIEAKVNVAQDAVTFHIDQRWLGTQFTLEFDPASLRVVGWELGDLEALSSENFGWQWLEEGKIPVSWNATHTNHGTALITLHVERLGTLDWSKAFQITSSITPIEAFSAAEIYQEIHLKVLDYPQEAISLLTLNPNPFTAQCEVEFFVPAPEKVKLTLFDAVGNLLYEEQLAAAAGHHNIQIDATPFPIGLIYYQLETANMTKIGKAIRVK